MLGPQFKFSKYGQSGMELSEVLPHLSEVVDDLCFIKSMKTEQFNHAPGQIFLNTGFAQPGRPSLGSWVIYGLGSEAQDLPAYVVMSTGSGISGGSANWSQRILCLLFMRACVFRNQGDPILDVSSPKGVDAKLQRASLDLIEEMNHARLGVVGDPEIESRISSYEMAYRLQTSAPELMDLKKESKETLEMYGCDPDKPSFARACVLARRLIERGVRFVNIYHEGWDAHSGCDWQFEKQLRRDRQSFGGFDQRSQATRLAGGYARYLGRRIWAHSNGEEQRRAGAQAGARPSPRRHSPCGWRAAASNPASLTVPPMTWAFTWFRTKFKFMICRPQSSVVWASTTND